MLPVGCRGKNRLMETVKIRGVWRERTVALRNNMEVLSLRVTVNICCQFRSFVFSNQGSQFRNKQTGRGGYLKDKIHSRFLEYKERNDLFSSSASTSTLPPKVLCFKCHQENFSRKVHSASARTTRLCQGTVGTTDKPKANQPGTFSQWVHIST